ncbi:MAG: hypothetical protein ACR2JZ_00800 [Candidatus Limnocylindrales bacterium]
MWQYYCVRANQVAQERLAEADEWRRARAFTRGKATAKARRPATLRVPFRRAASDF